MSIIVLKLVIVIYNKEMIDSTTCSSIISALESDYNSHTEVPYRLDLTIWNNGPSSISDNLSYNHDLSSFFKYEIIQHNMNMPLSKAYNEVLNKPNSKCDYFVIFDDDTQIPVNYFTQICIYDKLYGKLFKVPIVQQNGKIVSPIKANHKKLDFVGPGLLAGNDFSFVGSGMIIPYNFLEINKFDEAFNFYGIDHDISQTYLRDNVINIIPVILNHSLSTDFCDNKFPKFKVESLLFSTIYNGYKHGRKLSSSIRALKYCFRFIIRCKNIGYLTSFIRNYIFVYFVHKR